jgi:hypothetical protein
MKYTEEIEQISETWIINNVWLRRQEQESKKLFVQQIFIELGIFNMLQVK